ncbi:MAG: transcriptional repressor LexA [Clostridia bacterium]|nr:transcriptional repressor LexA [Clostridia bacterium]
MANRADREMKILEFMRENVKKNGYPPTVRDICSALNIKSTSTVHSALNSLAEQGYIRKDPVKKRAIEILDKESGEPVRRQVEAEEAAAERIDIVDVPVVGRIAAGEPILAEQNIEDSFPLPARYLGRGSNFMLTVHGDSMIEVGIFDGDYILVEETRNANNGEIVVAMIDGIESGATVKTFYKENGHIRLQPENSSMSPIIVNDCTILGKVKGVFRYFN